MYQSSDVQQDFSKPCSLSESMDSIWWVRRAGEGGWWAITSPGSGPNAVVAFPLWEANRTTTLKANDAALLEPKGNLSEDICGTKRSMAGQILLRDTCDIGTLLAAALQGKLPWPMLPEDESARLGS